MCIYIIYIFTSWGTFCSSSPEYQPVSNLTHRPSTDHLPENFKEPPAIMVCNSMVSTKNNRQQNQPSDRDWYYSKYWAFHGFQPQFFRIFPPKERTFGNFGVLRSHHTSLSKKLCRRSSPRAAATLINLAPRRGFLHERNVVPTNMEGF